MKKLNILKIVKKVVLYSFGLLIAILVIIFVSMFVEDKIFGYKIIDALKSSYLYEKFLNPKIQNDISYIMVLSRRNEHLEAYNYHDSTNIFIWEINNDAISIENVSIQSGFKLLKLKSNGKTYQNISFGTDPTFATGALMRFKFGKELLIKFTDAVKLISEQRTKNYYIMNCYFGALSFGSNNKYNEIIFYAFDKPKTNLAVFYKKGKMLIVWAAAREGLPPIRDNYLKEILKPKLFEKGLN